MNYWICNDSQGVSLYCGENKPTFSDDDIFISNEDTYYEWVDSEILDALHINYPKDLEVGECIQFKLKTKSKW